MRTVVAALCGLTLLLGGLLGGCADPAATSPGGQVEESAAAPSPTASESSAPDTTPTDDDATEAEEEPPAAMPVPESLRFRARTVAGKPFSGASLAGKPVLLWFWAPWCPTCRSQIPQVRDLEARYGDDVHVVGVGSLDDAEAIAGFARDVGDITHLTDAQGAVWRHFGVVEQSSFVLLDADGEEVFTAGYGGADDLDRRVGELAG